jgi:hypothetical protein
MTISLRKLLDSGVKHGMEEFERQSTLSIVLDTALSVQHNGQSDLRPVG